MARYFFLIPAQDNLKSWGHVLSYSGMGLIVFGIEQDIFFRIYKGEIEIQKFFRPI